MSGIQDSVVVYKQIHYLGGVSYPYEPRKNTLIDSIHTNNKNISANSVDIRSHKDIFTCGDMMMDYEYLGEAKKIPVKLSNEDQKLVDNAKSIERNQKLTFEHQKSAFGILNVMLGLVTTMAGIVLHTTPGKKLLAIPVALSGWIAPNIWDYFLGKTSMNYYKGDRNKAFERVSSAEKAFNPHDMNTACELGTARSKAYEAHEEMLDHARTVLAGH